MEGDEENKGFRESQTLRESTWKEGGKIAKEGVIPVRIWLVLGSLWGELRCNPLLSMQTWAEFSPNSPSG